MKSKLMTSYYASLLCTALLAGLAATPAMAQNTYTPGIDQAQQAVSARIQQGMQAGRITPSEAQALYRRDREIAMREANFKSDGNANPQERQQLRNDVAALSAEVERLINNRDVVGQGPRPGQGQYNPGTGIDMHEFNISQRIDEGIRTGRINRWEADRLQERFSTIESREAYFKSDGVLTEQERRQLRGELTALRNEVERAINHNGRRDGRYDGRRG
ncbi:MAG: hypothetical protein V4772_12535 [Pseudomonadota bacterium]